MDKHISNRKVLVLKTVFWVGAIGDGLIAIEWFLISLGLADLPVHPSFFAGQGQDFKYAMSIAGLFMMGWAFLLYWGSRKPLERKGLLLITAAFLLIATLSDALVFGHLFTTSQVVAGTLVKLFLVVLFTFSYLYSRIDSKGIK